MILIITFIYLIGCIVAYFFIDWWNLDPLAEQYHPINSFQSWKMVYYLYQKSKNNGTN